MICMHMSWFLRLGNKVVVYFPQHQLVRKDSMTVHICRGGKSSIQKVVFHKLSPNETLFLESTSKVVKDDINNSSFVQFQVRVYKVAQSSEECSCYIYHTFLCCRFGISLDR